MFNIWRIFEGIKSAVIRRDHKLAGMERRYHMLASVERLSGSPECNLNMIRKVTSSTTVRLIVYCGLVANNANWIVYNWFLQRCSSSLAQIPRWDHCSKASRKECNGMAAGPGYIQQGIGICKGCTGFKLEEYNTRRVRGVRIPGTGDRVPGRRCSAHAEKDQRSMNGKPSLSIKSYGRLIGGVAHKRIAGCRRSTYAGYDGVQEISQQFGMHGRGGECVVGRYIHEKKTGKIQGHESSWHNGARSECNNQDKNMAGHYPRATKARLEHECNGPGGRTNPFDGTWSGATGV
ncbi:hypothetical protein DFH06DRAFT_1145002 [Mycena polygramma]|nr:hypothetical protein DFH06DRAFT_1145002 [Mycena polygramma]